MSVAAVPGVFRTARPSIRFTVVDNSLAESDLSGNAVKTLLFLLRHEDGYVLTHERIAERVRLAVSTLRRALTELATAGYIVLTEVIERGRRTGTRFDVGDRPGHVIDSRPRKTITPKENRSRRDTTQKTRKTPSGGNAAALSRPSVEAPTPEPQEAPVTPPAETLALFDAPPVQDGKTARTSTEPSPAQLVVAAYVSSHEAKHGKPPTRGQLGRVGRDAKQLAEREPVELLVAAATEMGQGPYNNLAVAASIQRGVGTRQPRGRYTFAPPRNAPESVALQARLEAEVLADPAAAAWLAAGVA